MTSSHDVIVTWFFAGRSNTPAARIPDVLSSGGFRAGRTGRPPSILWETEKMRQIGGNVGRLIRKKLFIIWGLRLLYPSFSGASPSKSHQTLRPCTPLGLNQWTNSARCPTGHRARLSPPALPLISSSLFKVLGPPLMWSGRRWNKWRCLSPGWHTAVKSLGELCALQPCDNEAAAAAVWAYAVSSTMTD